MSDHTQTFLDWLTGAPLRVITVIVIAVIAHFVGNRGIRRTVKKLSSADFKPGPGVIARQAERAKTIGTVLTSAYNGIIWVIAVSMIVGEFGFNLAR